jgi:hypothetical protein
MYYGVMSEHKIEKAEYVVQSYFDHNDELVSANKFLIYDGQPETIENLSCEEVKHVLLRHGMWPQYTRRIKNLEKAEQEFWNIYNQEIDLAKKTRVLENIANMQSIIANCYASAKEFLAESKKGDRVN